MGQGREGHGVTTNSQLIRVAHKMIVNRLREPLSLDEKHVELGVLVSLWGSLFANSIGISVLVLTNSVVYPEEHECG